MRKLILFAILSVCIMRLGSKFPHDFRLVYFPEVGVTCLWFVGVESSAVECWGFQEAPEGIKQLIRSGEGWKCKK